MRNLPLNQSRVDRLKPLNSTYDIRDTDLKGFGIRISPSGKKSYFLQTQYEGQRRWTTISDADAMPEAEARSQARSLLAGIRKGQKCVPDLPAEMAFEAVADEVFAYYRRHWKPRTLAVNLNYYENNILPWFKGGRSPVLRGRRCWNGSSRFTRNRPRRTDLYRCCRSSCGRPRSTDTGQRTATLAKTSSATAAARGNASCRRTRSAVSSKFWTGMTGRARCRRPLSGYCC